MSKIKRILKTLLQYGWLSSHTHCKNNVYVKLAILTSTMHTLAPMKLTCIICKANKHTYKSTAKYKILLNYQIDKPKYSYSLVKNAHT